MNCDLCQSDQSLKAIWGCEEPTQQAVWEDGDNEYFSCPIRFICQAAFMWYNEHYYNDTYGVAPQYREQTPLYIEALQVYKRWHGWYMEQKMQRNKSKGKR